MKNRLFIYRFAFLFVLILGIFAGSCTKEEPPENSSDLMLKNGLVPQGDDPMSCDLIGGQNINVGQVIYSHDDDNLYVTFLTLNGWTLTEAHVYAGPLADIPKNNSGNLKIGHFPYKAEGLANLTSYEFTIPLDDIEKDANGYYAIVAHAVVVNGTQNETAYASCNPLITVKTRFVQTGQFSTWAVTDGVLIDNPDNHYCRIFGYNYYMKDAVYNLVSPYYPTPGQSGNVTVTDDGVNITLTVAANGGLKLMHTYVYVGSLAGLLSYIDNSGCINYEAFPDQLDTPAGADTHVFTLPLPKDITFKQAFGANQWGWINYYNF